MDEKNLDETAVELIDSCSCPSICEDEAVQNSVETEGSAALNGENQNNLDETAVGLIDSNSCPSICEDEAVQNRVETEESAALNDEESEKLLSNPQKNYKSILKKKRGTLFFKRLFDIVSSFIGIIVLLPLFIIVSVVVLFSGKGGIFFRQKRMGRKGKPFKIIKFRTMVKNAESKGMQITVGSDMRVTKIGKFLRKTKIDELPQLFNVFVGHMSIVGPRPEVEQFVNLYNDEQKNVLLVRPGITELASIVYRDENEVLAKAEDAFAAYVKEVMPRKLELNLNYIEKMNVFYDLKLIFKTFIAIVK